MERGKKTLFFFDLCVAALGLWLDQFTKNLAAARLMGQPPVSLIPGVLELRYLENRGAAFGILQNQKALFVVLTAAVLAALLFFLWRLPSAKHFFLLHLMGGFLAAGALGNFLDRIRLDYVVDFIYISLIDFPIFNVADMYVSGVCVLVVILIFWGPYQEKDFAFLKAPLERLKFWRR